jgi:hypothetical protein
MTTKDPSQSDAVENTVDKRLENLKKRKPFVKGFDPRRNLKGVPKDSVAMRKHMRAIAAELIGSGDTEMTRLDAALRLLWTSRNPAHNKLALQVLDPKILTESVDVTTGGESLTLVIRKASDVGNNNQ